MPKTAARRKPTGRDKSLKNQKKMPKYDPSQPVGDRCFLLEISAELRNRIYEYALITSKDYKPIVIQESTFAQPSLLCTCSQIRKEASKIYYLRNSFQFILDEWDPTILRSFCQQDKASWWSNYDDDNKTKLRGIEFDVDVHVARWINVLKWLKWYHDDEIIEGPGCITECQKCLLCNVTGAFEIVKQVGRLDWTEDILPILEIYKAGLGARGGFY